MTFGWTTFFFSHFSSDLDGLDQLPNDIRLLFPLTKCIALLAVPKCHFSFAKRINFHTFVSKIIVEKGGERYTVFFFED
jgi:hypothetical protein